MHVYCVWGGEWIFYDVNTYFLFWRFPLSSVGGFHYLVYEITTLGVIILLFFVHLSPVSSCSLCCCTKPATYLNLTRLPRSADCPLGQVLAFIDMQPASMATPSQGRHRRTYSIPPLPFSFNLAPARIRGPPTMSLQGSKRPSPPPGPLLLISSDYKDFDPDQLCRYQEEGYRVHYRQNADLKWFQEMADDIEANEPYAIIGLLYLSPVLVKKKTLNE